MAKLMNRLVLLFSVIILEAREFVMNGMYARMEVVVNGK